jgi:hypothetical protein
VAQGPASSCRAPQRAKGTDARKLWVPEEIGCRLQEYDSPFWNGKAQGTQSQGTRPVQCHTRRPEIMDAQVGTTNAPGGQQGNKGPRRQTAAISVEGGDTANGIGG